jgi:hypothetical protein
MEEMLGVLILELQKAIREWGVISISFGTVNRDFDRFIEDFDRISIFSFKNLKFKFEP